jgi:predicted dehydrogenase
LPYVDAPRYIVAERIAPFSPRGTDVSVVLDLMIHDLDLVLALTGAPEVSDVRAVGTQVLSEHHDLVNARLELPGGSVATVTASRVGRDRIRRIRVYQEGGISPDLASGRTPPGTARLAARHGHEPRRRGRAVPLEAPEGDTLRLGSRSLHRRYGVRIGA